MVKLPTIDNKVIFVRDVIDQFVEKHNCNKNQLYYYLFKWNGLMMWNYGVNICCGWFEFGYFPERYKLLVPTRVVRKLRLYKYFSYEIFDKKSMGYIKPIERKFFRYFIKQSNIKAYRNLVIKNAYMSCNIEDLINKYSTNNQCDKNVLRYYIKKWRKQGWLFTKYNWIDFDRIPYKLYVSIPRRRLQKQIQIKITEINRKGE